MITTIEFRSIGEMAAVASDPNAVVVSMLDRSEGPHRPTFEGFKACLCLEFEDASEPPDAEAWPDQPSDAEHARFAQGRLEQVVTLDDAHRIVAFVRRHHQGDEPVRLIAHCFGGISRSAAVAQWVSTLLWVPLTCPGQRDTDGANPRLLRLLDKAAGRK